MIAQLHNKKKIFNDPVYGFITIPHPVLFDLIEHPYFQRLRRIKQLGLTHLVYPGALHTRFHHALGAMHLMTKALHVLRKKGADISEEEELAVLAAILLHDIGHGPFSHALEHDIVSGVGHEKISALFIQKLSVIFPVLEVSLAIFRNEHPKPFLYQLVSSQLDMDRLDYLNRDSFYTGVSEGVIGSERLIEMLVVVDGQLMLEEKGIYSAEKFIVARRLMYWQVYLHKAAVSAEFLLIQVIRRAKSLRLNGQELFASPAFQFFLSENITWKDFQTNPNVLENFALLDDFDIMGAIKVWQQHQDPVLSFLAKSIINRNLFKIEISRSPFSVEKIQAIKAQIQDRLGCSASEADYFVLSDRLTNNAYNQHQQKINLLMKNGTVMDLSLASDHLNISTLSHQVEKFCLIYPKI